MFLLYAIIYAGFVLISAIDPQVRGGRHWRTKPCGYLRIRADNFRIDAGLCASIIAGIVSSVGLILLPPDMFERYGLKRCAAPFGLDNPGIISIPLSFIMLVIVSLLPQEKPKAASAV